MRCPRGCDAPGTVDVAAAAARRPSGGVIGRMRLVYRIGKHAHIRGDDLRRWGCTPPAARAAEITCDLLRPRCTLAVLADVGFTYADLRAMGLRREHLAPDDRGWWDPFTLTAQMGATAAALMEDLGWGAADIVAHRLDGADLETLGVSVAMLADDGGLTADVFCAADYPLRDWVRLGLDRALLKKLVPSPMHYARLSGMPEWDIESITRQFLLENDDFDRLVGNVAALRL